MSACVRVCGERAQHATGREYRRCKGRCGSSSSSGSSSNVGNNEATLSAFVRCADGCFLVAKLAGCKILHGNGFKTGVVTLEYHFPI